MPYSDTEILSGILLAACLLLLYCNYSKKKPADGMHANKHLPGLKFRDGYVHGWPKRHPTSYTTRSHHFQEGLDVTHGLNENTVRSTPASVAVKPPTGAENSMHWVPDAVIPLDVYNRDGAPNSHTLSADDELTMYNNVFSRAVNSNKTDGAGSVTGCTLRYVDLTNDVGTNMSASRSVTMG